MCYTIYVYRTGCFMERELEEAREGKASAGWRKGNRSSLSQNLCWVGFERWGKKDQIFLDLHVCSGGKDGQKVQEKEAADRRSSVLSMPGL